MSTTRGSYFMTELMAALAAATEASGHVAELVFDVFPPLTEDRIYVAVPHEFEAWGEASGLPDAAQLARTIALCTENPGTQWFESTARLVAGFGAAVSINRSSAAELRRRGVGCEHLQLGYTERWDCWRGDESSERSIDVLYLGASDPRRDPLLAGIGARLWSRTCQFLVPPLEPRIAPRPDFLKGQEKYSRLGQAKVLLNLHRTTSAAFEWMRFLEAICNGSVVVSEPSLDGGPLIAGAHFVQAPVERLGDTVDALLDDPPHLRAIRERAYEFVRSELPIESAGRQLVDLADELLRRSATAAATLDRAARHAAESQPSAPTRPPRDPAPTTSTGAAHSLELSAVLAQACSATWADGSSAAEDPGVGDAATGTSGLRGVRRSLRAVGRRLGGLRGHAENATLESPTYAAAAPSVSVLATIAAGREREGVELLECVAAADSDELEIVVIVDRTILFGRPAIGRFVARHPGVPVLALSSQADGLGAARNAAAERARAARLLVLPREGGIFPTTVSRLAGALDADPHTWFAYPMVAVVDDGAPVELRGSMPWEPERLTRENWIDAPALIRRERLIELQGYGTDPRLSGLEDHDLWCRIADASGHGVHVPQVLAWRAAYEGVPPRELASLPPEVRELLRERSPHLFARPADG
ncbi:MAG TPA: hypothetical protein VN672_06020 [Solirubrobacteraceae bacterium]|nr:hypothetical protein [Solirubrobacteraceae bacterium]